MAAPAWATNMTNFWVTATGATTVTALGGGASGLGNPETDFFIESTSCLSKAAWTNALKGFIVDALGTTFTVPTDGAIILFAKYDAQGSLDTKANGGLRVIVGSSSSDYYHYYIGGNNTLAFDTWVPYTIDPNTATVDATTGTPSGSERWVGILGNLPTTSGPTKGNPIAIDAIRYGRCDVEYTNGDLGNGYNTFSGAEGYANATTRRWGLIQLENGSYIVQGFHSLGTSGTAVDFRDSNKVLFWRAAGNNNTTNDAVSTGFNRLEILNASSNVDWDNIIFQSLDTRAKGVFVHTAGTFDAVDCQFIDWDTFTFNSSSTLTGCIFRRCNTITAGNGTYDSCQFIETPATSAVSNSTLNDFTDCEFVSDGSSYGINLGTVSSSVAMTWANFATGYQAYSASGSSTGNEVILVNVATSQTLTINVSTGYSSPSFNNTGAGTVTVVASVTVTVTVKDVTGAVIENAQTGIFATDDGTQIMNTDTNASGVATTSYSGSTPREVKVWIRKASSTDSPRYKNYSSVQNISATGLTLDVTLIVDPNNNATT